MSNPIGWFEIYVEEMQRAKAFYEAVLQVTLTQMENPDPEGFADMEMWAFPYEPEGPGASGALVKMPGYAPGKGGTLVYFSCEDCSVETARAVAHGGTLQRRPLAWVSAQKQEKQKRTDLWFYFSEKQLSLLVSCFSERAINSSELCCSGRKDVDW